jgi:transposase
MPRPGFRKSLRQFQQQFASEDACAEHLTVCRWRDKGIWEGLLDVLIDEPDYEWQMIDASHCNVHPHAAGTKGGNQDMSGTKGGSTPRYIWPWMRMVCRSESL